jgi:site-specific recombinase XerD
MADKSPPLTADTIAIDSYQNPSTIKIHLSISKTDQFGKDIDIYLGRTNSDLCPMLRYLVKRPGPRSGPLFILQNGIPLQRDQFVRYLKDALDAAGISHAHYSGHSFRIGSVTAAARAGVPDHLIKALGRWESEAYQIYIRTPPSTLAALSSSLT